MDSEVMITFNKALLSVTESKAPISKQKIFDITKAAMNAIRYFKHVVLAIEKFLVKCRSEHKLSGLYVMDSILRQAKKQYKHKDVFAPRFAVNLQNTFTNILTCDTNDRLKVVRVINLWQANEIFKDEK
uniref:CID domain-containing protein n=1 Tax=Ditylenchus dipsaci TaxID=166011 RepID=A0A915CMM2_9BILA